VGREPVIVLDTHALVWWVAGSPQLSRRALGVIGKSLKAGPVVASAISVFEIATGVRRGRIKLGCALDQWLADLSGLAEVRFEAVGIEIARRAGSFPDSTLGDPSDRIIAATAIEFGGKLVTADRRLAAIPGLEVVW
jgi:PIN domain nuclease of toxin-antitoxin system